MVVLNWFDELKRLVPTEGFVKLTSAGRTIRNRSRLSTGTRDLSPRYECSLPKDSVIDSSDVVASDSEQILNRTVYRKETLGLGH